MHPAFTEEDVWGHAILKIQEQNLSGGRPGGVTAKITRL